ncbi:MAG: hypothetical protein CL920_34125 [Deltaproteobacteria bacterium]|nr:hypothetical protein [Deltaproteobacteria bacterium]MBU53761.1 hypothetical protein [Deltaproteobacteria bacterium]
MAENNQERQPQIQFDGNAFHLQQAHWLNEGVLLEECDITLPDWLIGKTIHNTKQVRGRLHHLRCRLDRSYLTALISRTLSGGGLSELQIRIEQSRVEINGILSREGRRTPFWTRGFLLEQAGPYGGAVFYDIRLFGRPGLPAPALIPLLSARTGRNGPVRVRGVVTLQFDPLSLLTRWGLASAGWKIPSYQSTRLHHLSVDTDHIQLLYDQPQAIQNFTPLAKSDPLYGQWMALRQAEQLFLNAEALIGRGEYKAAIQSYEEELWRHPGHLFVQERLMQLYIASPQKELWNKAYRLAEEMLKRDSQALAALNCLAQYAEGIQDYQMAAHFYTQMGEASRAQSEHNEAALAFGKAAELLEGVDTEKARQLWHQTRKENANYRPAIAALARHALKAGRYSEAESILKDLIDQTPPSSERARHHLSLAGLYRSRLRDLNQAQEQLDQAAPFLAEDIAYLRELAEYRLATDENLDALRILDKLLDRVKLLNHPTLQADIYFRTGQILEERLARPGGALQRYRFALEIRADHPHAKKRAAALRAANIQEEDFTVKGLDAVTLQIEEKERALQMESQLNPTQLANLHLDLAKLYWKGEHVEQAISHAKQTLEHQSTLDTAWQLLEEICVHTGRQTELADLHRQMSEQALFDLDAIRHLEEALRLLPTDQETLQLLSKRYHKLQQWEKLDTLYARWIESADESERPDLWLKKAKLLEQNLQKLPEAEVAFIEAYQAATDRIPLFEELIQYYIRHNEWNKLDRQLDRLAETLPTEQQAALYAEKGRLLTEHPRKQLEALEGYQRAIELTPENPHYLQFAIELAQSLEKTDQLISLYGAFADATNDTQQEIESRMALVNFHIQQDDTEQARKELQRVIKLNNTHTQALTQLAEIYEQNHEYKLAASTYQKWLEAVDTPDEKAHLLKKLIVLFEELSNHKQLDDAIEKLLKYVPDYGKDETSSIPEFAFPSPEVEQARILYTLGRQEGNPDLLLRAALRVEEQTPSIAQTCLLQGLELEPFSPKIWHFRLERSEELQRPGIWKQLSEQFKKTEIEETHVEQLNEFFDQLGALTPKTEELGQLHKNLRKEEKSIPQLSTLYINSLENDGDIEGALAVRQEVLPQMPAGEEKTALQFEIAIHQIQLLGDPEGGKKNLWEIIESNPRHLDAFHELQELYINEDDLAGFVTQLEALAAQATPGPERADLYIQAFELCRDLLGDEGEALQLLERAKDAASDDSTTLQVLAAAYEELAALEEAAQLYEQVASFAEGDDALQALERAGELYHQELDQPDRALDIYQLLLEKDPTSQIATAQLKAIYDSLWMWDELIEVTNHEIQHLEDKILKSKRLKELAELYLGRLEDYEKSLSTYRLALRENPKDTGILQALHALYEDLEDWPAVVSALKAMTRSEVDPKQICDNYIQIATLSLDRLYRPEETEKYYKLAHNQQPDRTDPLQGLVDFYDATENIEELAQTAAQLAILQMKQDHNEKSEEALKRMLHAIEKFEEKTDPETVLRGVLIEQQETADLAQKVFTKLRELTVAGLVDTEVSVSQKLYEQQLFELSWLYRVWNESEEESLSPQQKNLLVQTAFSEQWTALQKQLNSLAESSQVLDETASYRLSMAEIALYHLNQPEQAIEYSENALQLGAPPERALLIAETHQRQAGALQVNQLIDTVQRFVHPDEHPRALYHVASTFLQEPNKHAEALQCLIEAMSQIPDYNADALVESLHELAEKMAQQPGSASALLPTIPANLPEEQQHLLKAWLQWTAGNDSEAHQHLETAAQINEDMVPALRVLGDIHYNSQQPEHSEYYLYRYLELEWERLPYDEVVEICLKLAHLAERQEDWDNVLFYTDQASKFIPEEQRIHEQHIRALERAMMWEELRSYLEQRIDSPEPTDDVAELWFALGRIHSDQFNETEEARQCYENAVKLNPEHEKALEAIQSTIQI